MVWAFEKSKFVQSPYKPAAIRDFYFALARNLDFALARNLDLNLSFVIDHGFDLDLDRDLDLDLALTRALTRARARARDPVRARVLTRSLDLDLDFALTRALAPAFNSELTNNLEGLKAAFPISSRIDKEFQEWWQAHGSQWVEQLRQVMIQHRNIGRDWQLAHSQKQQLQRYYDANRFLVELIKIEGATTDRVRTEIEDSLLLPWEELQRRYPNTYGQSQHP